MKKSVWLVGIALVITCSMVGPVQAFSLGEIEVRSYLSVPFVAEVSLVLDVHERDKGFVVMIGDVHEYEAEDLPRPPVVDLLRPVVSTDPPARVLLYSDEPIQVPSFNLLLSIRSGTLTIVRNYAVTLSAAPLLTSVASPPPVREMTQVASVTTPPVPEPSSSQEPAVSTKTPVQEKVPAVADALASEQPAAAPKPRAKAARRKKAGAAATTSAPKWVQKLPKVYGPVQDGETLYRVVENLGVPRGVIWQVVVQLWRDNPDRFFAGNIHGLLSGLYLKFPAKEAWQKVVTDTSLEEAQEIVEEQWGAWREMRRAGLKQQREPQNVLAKPAPVETVHIESQLEAEQETPPSVVLSTQEPSAMVTVTELQSVLQGLEERLTQRLSIPSTTPEEHADEPVAFVSATELQVALRGLEGRLSEQLDQVAKHQPFMGTTASVLSPQTIAPSLQRGAGVETLLGPLLSTEMIVYVLIFQNIILFTLACGFAWRWYRNRA